MSLCLWVVRLTHIVLSPFLSKIQDLPVHQRGDAVSSMVYEANARVRDPVYGCVGAISSLQQQVIHLQSQLTVANAKILSLQMHQAKVAPT